MPSPPPATSGVRRHVSLTYGAAVGASRKVATSTGLKRAGTVQGAGSTPAQSQNSSPPATAGHAEEEDYSYEQEDPSLYEDDYYFGQQQQQQQFTNTSIGRSSPWSSNNDWRTLSSTGPGNGNGNVAIDDVQRALQALELVSNPHTLPPGVPYGNYQPPANQNTNPPRFNTTQPLSHQNTGSRGSNGNGSNNNYNNGNNNKMSSTDFDGRKTPLSQQQPRGSGYLQHQRDDRGQAPSGNGWDQQRDPGLRGRGSNTNMHYGYQQGTGHTKSGSGNSNGSITVPSVPPIPQQYLQQQGQGAGGRPGLGVATSFGNQSPSGQTPAQGFVTTPIDVPSLIATKGYNPSTFETRPQFARFFVIKSYTEDDVHKSLKYEIWSSTDPGNKRLDKAFKDTAGRGPIYLFFSVNTSGHFCGMAEMLTPVSFIFVVTYFFCVNTLIV